MPMRKEKLYDETADATNKITNKASKSTAAAAPVKDTAKAAGTTPAANTVASQKNTAENTPKTPIKTDVQASAKTGDSPVNSAVNALNQSQTAAADSKPVIWKPAAAKSDSDVSDIRNEIDRLYKTAADNAADKIDSETEASEMELRQAEENAANSYKDERARVAADEARALDNAALYASIRGDRGGIGAAQYNSVMSAAENSRAAISAEQQKLASDTANEIAELNAKGKYEKANALLEITQERLGKLTELSKWAADYKMDEAELNNEIEKWRAELDLKKETLEAESRSKEKSNVTTDASELFEAMYSSGNPYTWLTSNAGKYGIYISSPTVLSEVMKEYRAWAAANK